MNTRFGFSVAFGGTLVLLGGASGGGKAPSRSGPDELLVEQSIAFAESAD
jgi:hypothetical protein